MQSPAFLQIQEIQDVTFDSVARDLDLPAQSRLKRAVKRTLDLMLALALLVVLSPVVLVAAVLVAVFDRQWPFYRDQRAGQGGRPFTCIKLRSMRSDEKLFATYLAANPDEAERYRVVSKVLYDPRKTRIGSLLRKLSIDEVPQLISVVLGQMSIVGPRPMVLSEFQNRFPASSEVVRVKPGLTGLWQVMGRSDLPEEQRDLFDLYYVRGWGIGMDLHILLKTPLVILTGRGAR